MGVTVPAMKLDGTRLQGTRTISRALDSLVPLPPLFPEDAERRCAVEEAEAWGDEVLQPVPNVRRDLDALPGLIDRVDELIEGGVIGGDERNAADFQIATSVSLLLTMDDIRPMIEGRPAERLARAIVLHQPGHTPSVYAV